MNIVNAFERLALVAVTGALLYSIGQVNEAKSAESPPGNQALATGGLPSWFASPIANPWDVSEANVYHVIAKLAGDMQRCPGRPPIVLEDWERDWLSIVPDVKRQGVIVMSFCVLNWRLPLISMSCRGKSLKEILDEACNKAGTYEWKYLDRHGTVRISRTELLSEGRWPLNDRLGAHGEKAMTLDEAVGLLRREYGLDLEDGSTVLALAAEERERVGKQQVWPGGDLPEATARDLLHALISVVNAALPDDSAVWYRVWLWTDFDRTEGYAITPQMDKLKWTVSREPVLDANALVRAAEAWKRSLDEQRKQFGTSQEAKAYFTRLWEDQQKNADLPNEMHDVPN